MRRSTDAVLWKDTAGSRSIEEINGEVFLVFRIPIGQIIELLPTPSDYRLTPREQQILSSLLRGLSDKEIAEYMNLSVRTVKFHNSHLYKKMNVSGRGQLLLKTA